jgi:hypothetical protein
MATDAEINAGLENIKSWPFQNHRAVILPYDEKQTWLFPEEFLGRMYVRLRSEGLLDVSFPGSKLNHLNRFITYMANIRFGFVIGCVKTIKKPHPVGWAYLTEIDADAEDGKRKASFAFGFFKEIHGRREHVDLSMFYLKYWFDVFKVDQLYGTTLNPLAFNYSKRFGFQSLCVLPKFFDGKPARLITLTPEAFKPHYDAWKVTTAPPAEAATLTLV